MDELNALTRRLHLEDLVELAQQSFPTAERAAFILYARELGASPKVLADLEDAHSAVEARPSQPEAESRARTDEIATVPIVRAAPPVRLARIELSLTHSAPSDC